MRKHWGGCGCFWRGAAWWRWRLAAAADGPGEVRSPRLDGMPRGHGTRGGTLAVLGRMEALADECAEIEGELRALSARGGRADSGAAAGAAPAGDAAEVSGVARGIGRGQRRGV